MKEIRTWNGMEWNGMSLRLLFSVSVKRNSVTGQLIGKMDA